MRLVVVTHYFPAHRGGIELVADALIRELVGDGAATVEWFASDCDQPPAGGPSLTVKPMPSWNGLETQTGLPYPLWSPRAWPLLWRAIRRCDLVHIHDYIYPGSLLAWTMAKLVRRPCIITQHVGSVPLSSRLLGFLLRFTHGTLGRLLLRRTAAVVFVSDVVRRQFFHAADSRVSVIANGVDTATFRPLDSSRRAALRDQLGFGDRPVLLFVGRFVAKKGLPLLRQLLPLLPQVQWVFAGRGPLDPESWNQPSLRIFRDRTGATLAELYQAADLLVLPSTGEGFPLVVQEAMACGTPVLASSELRGALPEVERVMMTEEVHGAQAPDRWLARLNALLDDPARMAATGQATAEFAAQRWSWRRCAASYFDAYRKAMSR